MRFSYLIAIVVPVEKQVQKLYREIHTNGTVQNGKLENSSSVTNVSPSMANGGPPLSPSSASFPSIQHQKSMNSVDNLASDPSLEEQYKNKSVWKFGRVTKLIKDNIKK